MRRLYRHLVILSGITLTAVVAADATAQDAYRSDQQQAAAVRRVRHFVAGETEVISSGTYVAGSYLEGDGFDGTYVDGEMIGESGACCDSGCDGGRDGGCGRGRRNQRIDGVDPWYNCSCNGSYKFPVPPLYTYHWPGMYSQELMTNYHSPWRFPPLRPYEDEPAPAQIEPQAGVMPDYLPVSHRTTGSLSSSRPNPSSRRHGHESYSAKIKRFYGTAR